MLTDTSSFDQRPSSPERDEGSDIQETEQQHVIDLITNTAPSRETAAAADDLAGLEFTSESLSDASIPEVQDTISEPFSSVNIKEEEAQETTASDS